VRRILALKFQLGLFDNPFVDSAAAARVVGCPEFAAAATTAQSRSVTVLERPGRLGFTPAISLTDIVYVNGMAPDALTAGGIAVTTDLADATVALVRLSTPHQMLHPNHFFGARQHEGDLDFKPDDPDLLALAEVAAHVATIVVINLDRAAVVANIVPHASALLAEYGISDSALVAALLGEAETQGRLPIALPSNMTSVTSADGLFDVLYPVGTGT
jgi:beta-glucosidase